MTTHRFRGALVVDVAPNLGDDKPAPIELAHREASRTFEPGLVTELSPAGHNFVRSFAVLPSGSGVGREAEVEHGRALAQFADYVRQEGIAFVMVESDQSADDDWKITDSAA